MYTRLVLPLAGLTLEQAKKRTAPFGLRLQRHPCKVIKIYDGDSVTLCWRDAHDERLIRANVRLYGINAPEMRGGTEETRREAVRARDMLSELVLGDILAATTLGKTGLDKFGRPLVRLESHPQWTTPRVQDALRPHRSSLNSWCLSTLPGCVQFMVSEEHGEP